MAQTSARALGERFAENLGDSAVSVLSARDYYWHVQQDAWARIGLQRPFRLTRGLDLVVDFDVTSSPFLTPALGLSDSLGSFRGSEFVPRLYHWPEAPPFRGRLSPGSGLKTELVSSSADLSVFGVGCKGTGAERPTLRLAGDAEPAGQVRVTLCSALPNHPTLLAIGFDNRRPFPIVTGVSGCRLYHSVDVMLAARTDGKGTLTIPIELPANPRLEGHRFYVQFFQIENANHGMRASNYGRVLLGR